LTRIVVDASVAVKWLLPEVHSDAARRLLVREGTELWAPDLIWAEVGNTLWKKIRRGEVPAETASELQEKFRRFPLRIHPSQSLGGTAWILARDFDRSFYDSLYLALALHRACPFVTADRKLYNALERNTAREILVWVEDVE
jgi:predicted nucleic acid-binding protein